MPNDAAADKAGSAEHGDGANRSLPPWLKFSNPCRSFSLLRYLSGRLEQPTREETLTLCRDTLRSGARELSQRIEARLLLAAQRGIELIQCRLHQVGCLHHGLEPLLHRLQPSDRRERHVVRAGSLQPLKRPSPSPPLRRSSASFCMPAGRVTASIRSIGRWVRLDFGSPQVSDCAFRFLLRLPLRALADIGAERIETCLLLVAERIIELLQCGPHDPHCLERGADAVSSSPASGRAESSHTTRRKTSLNASAAFAAALFKLVERCTLLGRRPYRLLD